MFEPCKKFHTFYLFLKKETKRYTEIFTRPPSKIKLRLKKYTFWVFFYYDFEFLMSRSIELKKKELIGSWTWYEVGLSISFLIASMFHLNKIKNRIKKIKISSEFLKKSRNFFWQHWKLGVANSVAEPNSSRQQPSRQLETFRAVTQIISSQ